MHVTFRFLLTCHVGVDSHLRRSFGALRYVPLVLRVLSSQSNLSGLIVALIMHTRAGQIVGVSCTVKANIVPVTNLPS